MTTQKQLITKFEKCYVKNGTAKFHRFHITKHCSMRATSSEIPLLVLDELPLLVVDENSELNTTFEKVCIDVNDRYCKILQARKYEVYGVTHSLPKYKENDRSSHNKILMLLKEVFILLKEKIWTNFTFMLMVLILNVTHVKNFGNRLTHHWARMLLM